MRRGIALAFAAIVVAGALTRVFGPARAEDAATSRPASPETSPPAVPAPPRDASLESTRAAVADAIASGRIGEAVARCADLPRAALDRALRERCALAAVALGDRLASAGQMSLARSRWEQALDLDPALADRQDFMERFTLPVWAASEDDASPADASSEDAPSEDSPDAEPADDAQPASRETRATSVEPWRAARGDLAIGLGAGWFDGLLGATVGVVSDGLFDATVSIGLLYPSTDLRVRYLPVEDALTPTVGLGLFVPYETEPRTEGAAISGLASLYELGDAFHLDVGAAWFHGGGLSVSATLSFVTTVDQDHPDAVVFYPQLSAGVAWSL